MGSRTRDKESIQRAARNAAAGLPWKTSRPAPRPTLHGSVTPSTSPVVFEYFDRVFVINLDHDAERLTRVGKRLGRLGMAFDRFAACLPAPQDMENASQPQVTVGHFAAARSHRALLKQAYERGCERIVILEDDVVFRDDVTEWMRKIVPQLRSVAWDVFYFGLKLEEDGGPVTENLGKVKEGFHTHAYAVTRRAMPLLIDSIDRSFKQPFNYDYFLHPDLVKVYAKPILAVQEPNFSATLGHWIDRCSEYFPPFDEQDFLAHCREARAWAWRPKRGPEASDLVGHAKSLHRRGELTKARKLYERALDLKPDDPEALHYLGLLHHQQGKGAAAVDLMYRAVAARPDSPEFHCNLGMVLGRAARLQEALEILERALELKADYPEALDNRGLVLERLGKLDDAMADWQRAIALRPEFPAALTHLGKALVLKERPQEALEHLRKAVALDSRSPEVHNHLGCALRATGEMDGAVAAFRTATQVEPAAPEGHSNLGTALYELGEPQQAIVHLEKAIELRSDYPDAHWNLSLALLACSDMDRGWLEYEWRRHAQAKKLPPRNFLQMEWNGCCVTGRTVLLVCEQGLGDTLQFIRYAALVSARGAKVVVECQPPLAEILRGAKGVSQIVARGEPLPVFDAWARLLSLPGLFNTRMGNIPADVPYLYSDPKREAAWKPRLAGPGFKVGISWQGSNQFGNDRCRSVPLAHFQPLAEVEGVRLFSLQKNLGTEQLPGVADQFRVEQFDPPLDQGTGAFMDTAAVMSQLDLVVTSDTAIAHLAGALGVRVWVALNYNCDWRFFRDREDCPWYPTMRLFRPQKLGDWPGVFAKIARALRDTLNAAAADEPEPVMAPVAPGELIDRLSILQIKVQRVTDPVKLRTVRAELEALTVVRDSSLPHSEQLDELARELRTVNEMLWQIEDDIRGADAASDFGDKFVELARSVYRTNDRRAELKRRINTLLGSVIRDEKHYQAYRH